MPDYTSLLTHYDYWDIFVEKWRDGEFGRDTHLPEPWWGWCPEDGPLYSVTVNLSPGLGGKLQTRRCIECAAGCMNRKYSVMMLDGTLPYHLRQTEEWHLKRRHLPLMHALGDKDTDKNTDNSTINKIVTDTHHHLSIELSPFHDDANNAIYQKTHTDDIINHSLLFAAKASTLITSPKAFKTTLTLKNIVIVRSTIKKIEDILGLEHNKIDAKDIPNSKAKVFFGHRAVW